MKAWDIVELAFQRFRTRSLRFLLTIFGVGVGIGVVFFLVALGFGLQDVVIGRISTSESLASLTVQLPEEVGGLITIDDTKVDAMKKIENVQDVSPVLSIATEIEYNNLKAQTIGQAVNPSYFNYSGLEPAGGQFYGADDTDGIVVSKTIFRLFGLNETDAIGKEVQLSFVTPQDTTTDNTNPGPNIINFGHPFRIVGYIESEANTIYIPLKVFSQLSPRTYSQVKIRLKSIDHINEVRSILLNQGYSVIALTDTLDQLNKIFRITQISLATLGVITLFIASVGMFNTLTISLLERTKEVGILKAIGATNQDVWKIFLFEAVLIGTLGGISGVLGGVAFSRLVNVGLNILAQRFGGQAVNIFRAPWWFILAIMAISISVGGITGLYPALRAAKLNPLKVLKSE